WRLRFEAKYACGFDIIMTLKHTILPHGSGSRQAAAGRGRDPSQRWVLNRFSTVCLGELASPR
ncbi:MAG TPA: hypothetical protein VIH58_02950, partial [Chthoniobacterales bacterium]